LKNPQPNHLNSTNLRSCAALAASLIVTLCAITPFASARPETIRAGVPYYSDELVENGSVRDIDVERNYEEVYQFYTYYEIYYDESERVTRCIEYKRGDEIRKDTYRYSADGSLQEHVVKTPGEPAKSVPIQEPK
jgi:hypothetical protein